MFVSAIITYILYTYESMVTQFFRMFLFIGQVSVMVIRGMIGAQQTGLTDERTEKVINEGRFKIKNTPKIPIHQKHYCPIKIISHLIVHILHILILCSAASRAQPRSLSFGLKLYRSTSLNLL